MATSAHEETVRFPSRGGVLEGRLAIPGGATDGAVICHPHPQYGGDMDNLVVVAIANALRAAGLATLRFNFRGVGGSDGSFDGGRGERDDTRAALSALRERLGVESPALIGYSFGAMIALAVADNTMRLAAIAPPLTLASAAVPGAAATLLVVGDHDAFCPLAALTETAAGWPKTRIVVLDGADHFFAGQAARIGAEVASFLRTP